MTVFPIGSKNYKSNKLPFQLKSYRYSCGCFSWGRYYYTSFHSFLEFSKYTGIFQDIKWVIILFPLLVESNPISEDTNGWSSVSVSTVHTHLPHCVCHCNSTVQKPPCCLNMHCFWLCCSLCLECSPQVCPPRKPSLAFQISAQASTVSSLKLSLSLPGGLSSSFLYLPNFFFDLFSPTLPTSE